jgi:hypothetical protein
MRGVSAVVIGCAALAALAVPAGAAMRSDRRPRGCRVPRGARRDHPGVPVHGRADPRAHGVVDPNDEVFPSCETAQRTFVGSMLPSSATVAAPSAVAIAIGRANVPLGFQATMSTAPAKHGAHTKARQIAKTTLPATTGAVRLTFTLPEVSKGFLSKRPDIRVQLAVTAIGADGRRYPLQLHARQPDVKLVTLRDNQVRLKIPAKLRHPHR